MTGPQPLLRHLSNASHSPDKLIPSMRIPFPDKIRLKYVVLFAVVLFVAQQLENTGLLYSMLCSAYLLVSCVAFNAAGGMALPGGGWIFFNALLVVVIGISFKACLGEQGDTHLGAPLLTMAVETIAMICYGFAGALARRLMPKQALLSRMVLGESMKRVALGSAILGMGITFLNLRASPEQLAAGSALSAVRQLNRLPELGMLLAVFYEVKASNGKKSVNWIFWMVAIWQTVFGLIGFSKQGMLEAAFLWLVTAVVAGHDFTRKQIFGLIAGAVFFQLFLAPVSQVGRNMVDRDQPSIRNAASVAWQLLTNLGEVRQTELRSEEATASSEGYHLYDSGYGLMDRLSMLAPDDALINYTAEGNVIGYEPFVFSFYNLVPHFLWADKPYVYFGNLYARELGILGEDDEGTGISFSPASDAYHQGEWAGICIMLTGLAFVLFFIQNSLSGDVRRTPWGILFLLVSAHDAPEGQVSEMTYDAFYTSFAVVLVALLGRYLLPLVTGIVTNADRTRVKRTLDFQPLDVPLAADGALGEESFPDDF